ncbi:MAG TPA: methylmalonyl Co-A mutase-associated GTPase MeaB [Polyangiaceae bacterium]|jgi:LAO/AO transport system kinase|nr:methylmalonyl Co-A mutase-associated GTPase MeaB [Polyangiaceae bacterium]
MDSAEAPETQEELEALTATIAAGVRAGERVAVARALNLVEDRRLEARPRIAALLRALGSGRPEGHRIGLTGPPGVGKSTLASTLAATLRRRGHTVGVLAVDPSSRRSGGALLGDRARIDTDPEDQGLFVRSLATAGELGGLARAAPAAVMVLAAAFDRVVVETVGVGQSETDVEHVVDTVVFVVQPGSGDALQFLKAGIMEIPDVLVVNKADMGEAATRARAELVGVLRVARSAGLPSAPQDGGDVVLVSATRRDGIDRLVDTIERHREALVTAGALVERRVRGQVEWGLRELLRRVGDEGVAREGGLAAARARIESRVRRGTGPF